MTDTKNVVGYAISRTRKISTASHNSGPIEEHAGFLAFAPPGMETSSEIVEAAGDEVYNITGWRRTSEEHVMAEVSRFVEENK